MIRPISEAEVKGRRLLVRADLNVPVDGRRVTDATRINRFGEGMRPLLEKGARLVIVTHFGRPDPDERDPSFSVDKLRPALTGALGAPVRFCDTVATDVAERYSQQLGEGEVLLCENLRYARGETANDPDFARRLSLAGDIYVNDAFSVSHRAHASTEGITHLLPSYAGPLLMAELEALGAALERPRKPAVAIVGGSKVSTKIAVLKNLVRKLDAVIVGGGMANTFLAAKGAPMGRSLHEADQLQTAREIMALARTAGCEIHLPADVVTARAFRENARTVIRGAFECPGDAMILDAGPRALEAFKSVLAGAETILWNGPLGAFEVPPFDWSTVELARFAASLTREAGTVTVAGGGDTVAALNLAQASRDFTYVSSAGGAFLEWLEGRALPGITALERQKEEV